MKVLIVVAAVLLASAMAEPQRYRAPAEYGAPDQTNEGPYLPSGWRPSGRQFLLPVRQASYYAPPPAEYGPPPATVAPTTTEAATEEEPTTTEVPTTTEPEEENEFADGNGASPNSQAQEQDEQGSGVYYVLLPDGRLQRVAYSTNQGNLPVQMSAPIRNAGYAQFQYMDVEPIRAPIYSSYGAPLVRIF